MGRRARGRLRALAALGRAPLDHQRHRRGRNHARRRRPRDARSVGPVRRGHDHPALLAARTDLQVRGRGRGRRGPRRRQFHRRCAPYRDPLPGQRPRDRSERDRQRRDRDLGRRRDLHRTRHRGARHGRAAQLHPRHRAGVRLRGQGHLSRRYGERHHDRGQPLPARAAAGVHRRRSRQHRARQPLRTVVAGGPYRRPRHLVARTADRRPFERGADRAPPRADGIADLARPLPAPCRADGGRPRRRKAQHRRR